MWPPADPLQRAGRHKGLRKLNSAIVANAIVDEVKLQPCHVQYAKSVRTQRVSLDWSAPFHMRADGSQSTMESNALRKKGGARIV